MLEMTSFSDWLMSQRADGGFAEAWSTLATKVFYSSFVFS